MMEKPVFYEMHPVSQERRAALLAAGYRIIDAVFQPEGYENPPDPQAVKGRLKKDGGGD